jgi:2-keto-3-deoxy-6-phosphogluconate aldolase
MMASGGTHLDNVLPFLEVGCVAIGLGGALADPALAVAGRFEEIRARAEAFVRRVEEAGRRLARPAPGVAPRSA